MHFFKGVVVHELLHILGVAHEQQRPDRDQFLTINWPNMKVFPYHTRRPVQKEYCLGFKKPCWVNYMYSSLGDDSQCICQCNLAGHQMVEIYLAL